MLKRLISRVSKQPLLRFFGQRFNMVLIRSTTAAQNGEIEFSCARDFVSCPGPTIACGHMIQFIEFFGGER